MVNAKIIYGSQTIVEFDENDAEVTVNSAGTFFEKDVGVCANFNNYNGKIVTNATITATPTKTSYGVEEVIIDTTGLEVTATFSDNTTKVVTDDCHISADNMQNGELTSYSNNLIIDYCGFISTIPITVIGHYLTFTANTANSVIKLTQVGTPSTTKNFEYSVDNKVNWIPFSFTAAGDGPEIILTNIGDKVYFRGNNSRLGESASIYNKFVMNGSISSFGDTNTLLDNTEKITSLAGKGYCFYSLFNGCTSLTTASELPAMTLALACYGSMFADCTGLTASSALPASTLAESCYSLMFRGCTALVTPPILVAKTLPNYCYQIMFSDCTSLLVWNASGSGHDKAWRIPTSGSASKGTDSTFNMFYNCPGSYSSTENVPVNTTFYTLNTPV